MDMYSRRIVGWQVSTSLPVTPSWAPESMNDVQRVTSRARWAVASPASAAACSRGRSTDLNANS